MSKKEELVVGLDIGTTRTRALVAEVCDDQIAILGYGNRESRGIIKGMVVNVDQTVEAIRQAIEDAELMANCAISTVHVGITGGHIKSINSHGIVPINKSGEVRPEDVTEVINNAKAISIPLDRQIIHIFPQDYIIDGQNGIKEPCGISGVRLEAKVHIVTAAVASTQNILKCANRCSLNIGETVLSSVASSEACLSDEEREIGSVLIDMGGGTTDVVVYQDGAIIFSTVLALGGNNLTKDIARGMGMPMAEAERLKCCFGHADASQVSRDEEIEVPGVGGRSCWMESRNRLCSIIEARAVELFELVKLQLLNNGIRQQLPGGIVISGGCANLAGIDDVADQILGLPVRIGTPMNLGGVKDAVNNPSFAQATGLVLYASQRSNRERFDSPPPGRLSQMWRWLKYIFE